LQRSLGEQETGLYQGHAAEIAQLLREEEAVHAAEKEALQTEAGYFANNHKRMDYLEMRIQGWVIGSGMVESGGKQ